ncbi:MAG TPA: hypothetical protein VL443_05170 [Cyclobacteriaceae bacterium]|nr:hypothetical protein [Cyclobacteriaceae bacterium]
MDDNKFDDLLKSKFEDYEYSSANAPDVAGFHERLVQYPTVSWYSKYRTELFVTTSFIFFTLLNSLIFWSTLATKEETRMSLEKNFKLHIADTIAQVINQLKSQQLQQQQTQIAILNSSDHSNIFKRERDHRDMGSIVETGQPRTIDSSLFYLGVASSIPKYFYDKLTDAGVLEIKSGGAYLNISDRVKLIRNTTYALAPPNQDLLFQSHDSLITPKAETTKTGSIAKVSNTISSKLINRIADTKYKSGIGINFSPHMDFANVAFSEGSGDVMRRLGVTVDWIVAPHWSIETSVDHFTTKVTLHEDFQKYNLPKLNPVEDGLQSVQIRAKTVSFPVALKYRWWLTSKNQLIFRMGYTPYISFHNEYRYTSPYPGQRADSDVTINTVEDFNKVRFYGGTTTAMAGISKLMNKKNQLEFSLFYERSVKGMGQEKLNMQLIGLRTAFLFNLNK